MPARPIDPRTLVTQLRTLGVRLSGVLQVHTSLRRTGPIGGGPLALIAALRDALGPDGTLVMPTMTAGDRVFDARSTPTVDMGITAELFWRQPGVVRSTHPGGSFAAIGPHAEAICAPQPLAPPHGPDSPPGRVYALGGQVLLLGVGHDADTMVHVAEAIAGVPYAVSYPCVIDVDGMPQTVMIAETDHCCEGFAKLDAPLRAAGLQREGPVGHGHARLSDAHAIITHAMASLADDPLYFLCAPAAGCAECDRARASVAT